MTLNTKIAIKKILKNKILIFVNESQDFIVYCIINEFIPKSKS